jgi:small-conductance mechanosensitive channel
MNYFPRAIVCVLLTGLLLLLGSNGVFAAEKTIQTKQQAQAELQDRLEARYKQLQTAFKQLKPLGYENLKTNTLDDLHRQIAEVDYSLEQCIADNTTQLESSKKNQDLLGEKQAQEDHAIQVKRVELANQSRVIDTALKRCSLLKIQLDQLAEEANLFRQDLVQKQFFAQEHSLLPRVERLLLLDNASLQHEFNAIQPILEKIYHKIEMPFLLLALVGAGLGVFWSRKGRLLALPAKESASPAFIAALRGIKRVSPVLFALFALWLTIVITQSNVSPILIQSLQYALLLFFIFGLVRGLLFPDDKAIKRHRFAAHSSLILSWLLISCTLLMYCFNHEETGRYSDSVVLYLVWLFSLVNAAFSAIVLLWIIAYKLLPKKRMYSFSLLPMLVLLSAIVAGVIGYRNLATLLIFATFNALMVLFMAFLILRISREFFNSLDQGKTAWQRQLRRSMDIAEEKAFPGVLWLRLLVFFTTILVTVFALMSIGGSSHQRIMTMVLSIKQGITIGDVTVDVLNLVYALLILITTLSILPFIQNQLVSNWLTHSNLSRGAKEATQKLVGYAGVAIAVFWAFHVAGVNFKNFAIIAGALSVGIGFGLKNIVSNFISGLILLFERPISRGDWVMVGATEGYVKDISIRSTTIQTFQQADVIVPNSELISNQVTNWMLSNTIGRLQVPIGVAYGSDVSLVMETLEEIANRHPAVISDHPDYSAYVLFLGFGESALNFELRCFLRNISKRSSTLSAINQGIDREFRKANIDIPFPQRVVHIRHEAEPNSESLSSK